jgi:hypothetical protein
MWRKCDANVGQMWHNCDANVTQMWRNCDAIVTQLWRKCAANVTQMWRKRPEKQIVCFEWQTRQFLSFVFTSNAQFKKQFYRKPIMAEFQVYRTHIIMYSRGILAPSNHSSITYWDPLAGKAGWENDVGIDPVGLTRILKGGVSQSCRPLVWLVWISLFCK